MRRFGKAVVALGVTGGLAFAGLGLGSAGASVVGEYPAAACDGLAGAPPNVDGATLRTYAQEIGASGELLAAGTQTKLLKAADDADAKVASDRKAKKEKKKARKAKKKAKKSKAKKHKKKYKKANKKYKKARNTSKRLARSRDAAIKDALDWCIGIGGATTTTRGGSSGGGSGGGSGTTTTKPSTTTTSSSTTSTTMMM